MSTTSKSSCLNCDATMANDVKYCENCGQAKLESRLKIIQLFKDFISNIFNLDGRLFRSIKHIWKPAFLAQEYISGKRRSYVNPIRFFLLMLVLLFFLLNNALNKESFDEGTIDAISTVEQKMFVDKYDSTICLVVPNISVDEEQKLRTTIFGPIKESSPKIFVGGNFMSWKIKGYEVTRFDAYSMDIDSLFVKYYLTKWYDQLFIRQLIKVDKDRSGSVSYFISKLIWGVILFIFLLALFMKLIYIRNLYYYVEHLIVAILLLAKLLLVFNLLLLLQHFEFYTPLWNILVFALYLSMIVYLYFTLKRYYKQGIIKTIAKTGILLFVSIYILIISVAAVSLISLALL